jgi:hypothetical protein
MADPQWGHSVHVVPLLAWLSKAGPLGPQGRIPKDVADHLFDALRNWSAFRGRGFLKAKRARFHRYLPDLVDGVRRSIRLTNETTLADVDPCDIDKLSRSLRGAFKGFQRVKKGKKHSDVLPSKTAHLLFPSMIPAYDDYVVVKWVMKRKFPHNIPGGASYANWIKVCNWVLRQLEDYGLLREARRLVLRQLIERTWAIKILRPRLPGALLGVGASMLDSFVAEYVLIGLAGSYRGRFKIV